ncbi:hypothetical protein [Rheinheimera soli]|uniref:Uncharacterized protein n=1 Tax=Rheinheimera soli TaxID=443616 RepID=A0ABU1W5E2_9GAMM|nr:hypothetical protein [Rheinheimera soli]MDR7123107.1 hypothetical protein [Rheinheimera soli]
MTEPQVNTTIKPLVMAFMQDLMKHYLGPLYHYIKDKPELIKTVPGFLLNHTKLIVYVGRTHIAVEYTGPEFIDELKPDRTIELQFHDYSYKECNLFEQIIGFKYDSTLDMKMPLPIFSEDLLFPTNRGWDKLTELGWNFAAQNSIMGFNMPSPEPMHGKFTRIVNGIFFDADDSGLKSRRIKWLDFFPVIFDGSDEKTDTIGFNLEKMGNLVEHDANYSYPIPDEFKFVQLPKINKFIEKWGNKKNSETDITSYLSEPENEFILTMKFGASNIYSELTCQWQSEDRKDIRPDFFVVQPNGYADIVEFKLPDIGKNTVVGSSCVFCPKVNTDSDLK